MVANEDTDRFRLALDNLLALQGLRLGSRGEVRSGFVNDHDKFQHAKVEREICRPLRRDQTCLVRWRVG